MEVADVDPLALVESVGLQTRIKLSAIASFDREVEALFDRTSRNEEGGMEASTHGVLLHNRNHSIVSSDSSIES